MTKIKSESYHEANKVVPVYIGAAVSAAVIPIPVADAVAITGVQLTMCTHITHGIYKSDVGYDTLKYLIASYAASNLGIWAWSLVKTIPGLGTAAGIVGQMTISGIVTAALGYAVTEILENNEPFTKENLKKAINRNKEKAKKAAEEAVKEKKDSIDELQKLLFTQDKDITDDDIEFSFNLEDLTNPKLICKHIKSQKERDFQLDKDQDHIKLDVENWESGQYEVKLTAGEIPDVMRFFVKKD